MPSRRGLALVLAVSWGLLSSTHETLFLPPRAQGRVPEREGASARPLEMEALGLLRGCLGLMLWAKVTRSPTLWAVEEETPPGLGGVAGVCVLAWEESLTVKPSATRCEIEYVSAGEP